MKDAFERRDSLRRYATVKLTPPTGAPVVMTKGTVSLRGIFFEGQDSLPASWSGALVGVETDLGGAAPLRAVCLVAAASERPKGGHMLTWKTLDFDAERELARYLDEAKPKQKA
jgi:hypothetical protein